MKMSMVDAGLGDIYMFPYEEGKTREEITTTVQWGPYQDGQLRFVIKPFAPVVGGVFNRPSEYPGRTHAKNAKEAKRIAEELFSHSQHCLRLNHGECVSRYGGHLASTEDWPDAPKCECECHKGEGN